MPAQPYPDKTSNILQQFDFAFSLSQQTINGQLRNARDSWMEDIDGYDRVRAEAPDGSGVATLDATLGELIVDLNASTLAAMRLEMPVMRGVLRSPAVGEFDLAGTTLRFTAPLQRRPVAMPVLRAAAPELADKAQDVIDELAMDSNMLSIEALYMDLTSMDRLTPLCVQQDGTQHMPEANVTAALLACLKALAQQQPVLLQAVVLPKRHEQPSSFTLRNFDYKITPCEHNPDAATLDYLGVFWHGLEMPLPADLAAARARLGPWVDPTRLDPTQGMRGGLLALRGELLAKSLAQTLKQAFDAAYARMNADNRRRRDQGAVNNPGKDLPHPEAELLENVSVLAQGRRIEIRSSDGCNSYHWKDDNVSYALKKSLWLTLTPTAGAGYALRGAIVVDLQRERTVNFDIVSSASSVITTGIEGSLDLNSPPDELECEVTTRLSLRFLAPNEVKTDNGNFWRSLLQVAVDYDQRMVSGFAADARQAMEKMLDDVLDALNFDLGTLAIVPPGGGVFTFAGPRFSRQDDLLLDIGYKAVMPQGEQP